MTVTTTELFRACEFLELDYATKSPETRWERGQLLKDFSVGQVFAVTKVIPGKGQVVLTRLRYVGNQEWELLPAQKEATG
jgi:hypothetical protein